MTLLSRVLQCHTVQLMLYSAAQCNSVPYSSIEYRTVQQVSDDTALRGRVVESNLNKSQVLCPKVQSKHGDRYHVSGTRQFLNRDRYNVLFGMLVSNRYSFVKQISVWNQTEKKKLQGTTFTLFFLYKSARYMYAVSSEA